ncbi:MAG: hypothetical protein JJE25_14410 [Bacteroidia bacterium]|nr:hypothetical protein [Bacteroidia bacterium]
MKTLLYSILILGSTILIVACTSSKPTTTEVIVLRDITENHLAKPQPDAILWLYDFSESKWNGASFRFVDLSDVSYNRTSETKIESVNQWMSNELEREKQIKRFKSDVVEILDSTDKETIGKNFSSVYLPMARELNRLSQSKSQKRIFLVFSDLMENSLGFSFYDKKVLQLLQSNPDSLRKRFDKMLPLQSLTGVEVHFIFEPENVIQDAEFKIVSEFYRKFFEDKGAIVTISANL